MAEQAAALESAEQQQQAAYVKQGKISQQLSVLKEHGPEGDLRLRYVRELEAEQDKVNACESDIKRLLTAAEEARKSTSAKLAELIK